MSKTKDNVIKIIDTMNNVLENIYKNYVKEEDN